MLTRLFPPQILYQKKNGEDEAFGRGEEDSVAVRAGCNFDLTDSLSLSLHSATLLSFFIIYFQTLRQQRGGGGGGRRALTRVDMISSPLPSMNIILDPYLSVFT